MPDAKPVFNMCKQVHRGTETCSEMLTERIIFNKLDPPTLIKIVPDRVLYNNQ
jgi:hypothetical protein